MTLCVFRIFTKIRQINGPDPEYRVIHNRNGSQPHRAISTLTNPKLLGTQPAYPYIVIGGSGGITPYPYIVVTGSGGD